MSADKAKIALAREMRLAGFMLKAIAIETGMSQQAVSRVCADIACPVNHLGRKKGVRSLCHREAPQGVLEW